MTTIEIVEETLKQRGETSFESIYQELKRRMLDQWETYREKYDLTWEQLESQKRGELYKILTISQSFTKLDDNMWIYETTIKE